MKKILALSAVALAAGAFAPSIAMADDGVSYNAGVVTDYRYRGISQTRLKPAVQGGIDYAKGAFYVGTWASTIKWIEDWKGDASVEWDIYGGYKGEISKDLAYDVGFLQYIYPGAKTGAWTAGGFKDPNTTELYAAFTFGPATVKYSHAFTTLFGTANSKNSGYLEAAATFDVAGVSVTPHLGYQSVAKNGDFSYLDYSLTVGKEVVKGLTLTGAVVGTDTKSIGGVKAYASPVNGKDLGKAAVVLGAKYAF
ncbi:MAG: hypothetical protein RLZZ584_2076 [Pseudomonadota bacterium]|jgi:uncharacterized protein (TIGR02001 family)